MNRHGTFFTGLALLLLVILAGALLAGCGGKEGTTSSEKGKATKTQGSVPEGGGSVLIVIADNQFQDLEYQTVRTALEGAGFRVVVSNPSGHTSIGVSSTQVEPDTALANASAGELAGLVIIGGPGARSLFSDQALAGLVTDFAKSGKPTTAICIAPVVLANAGVLKGKNATVWSDEKGALEAGGAIYQSQPVVVDGNIVTGDGPDASSQFAQAVVQSLAK